MAGMVFVSNGFNSGSPGYTLVTWGVAFLIVGSAAMFVTLVTIEVYRSIRYHKLHIAARDAEVERAEQAIRQARGGGGSNRRISDGLTRRTSLVDKLSSAALRRLGAIRRKSLLKRTVVDLIDGSVDTMKEVEFRGDDAAAVANAPLLSSSPGGDVPPAASTSHRQALRTGDGSAARRLSVLHSRASDGGGALGSGGSPLLPASRKVSSVEQTASRTQLRTVDGSPARRLSMLDTRLVGVGVAPPLPMGRRSPGTESRSFDNPLTAALAAASTAAASTAAASTAVARPHFVTPVDVGALASYSSVKKREQRASRMAREVSSADPGSRQFKMSQMSNSDA